MDPIKGDPLNSLIRNRGKLKEQNNKLKESLVNYVILNKERADQEKERDQLNKQLKQRQTEQNNLTKDIISKTDDENPIPNAITRQKELQEKLKSFPKGGEVKDQLKDIQGYEFEILSLLSQIAKQGSDLQRQVKTILDNDRDFKKIISAFTDKLGEMLGWSDLSETPLERVDKLLERAKDWLVEQVELCKKECRQKMMDCRSSYIYQPFPAGGSSPKLLIKVNSNKDSDWEFLDQFAEVLNTPDKLTLPTDFTKRKSVEKSLEEFTKFSSKLEDAISSIIDNMDNNNKNFIKEAYYVNSYSNEVKAIEKHQITKASATQVMEDAKKVLDDGKESKDELMQNIKELCERYNCGYLDGRDKSQKKKIKDYISTLLNQFSQETVKELCKKINNLIKMEDKALAEHRQEQENKRPEANKQIDDYNKWASAEIDELPGLYKEHLETAALKLWEFQAVIHHWKKEIFVQSQDFAKLLEANLEKVISKSEETINKLTKHDQKWKNLDNEIAIIKKKIGLIENSLQITDYNKQIRAERKKVNHRRTDHIDAIDSTKSKIEKRREQKKQNVIQTWKRYNDLIEGKNSEKELITTKRKLITHIIHFLEIENYSLDSLQAMVNECGTERQKDRFKRTEVQSALGKIAEVNTFLAECSMLLSPEKPTVLEKCRQKAIRALYQFILAYDESNEQKQDYSKALTEAEKSLGDDLIRRETLRSLSESYATRMLDRFAPFWSKPSDDNIWNELYDKLQNILEITRAEPCDLEKAILSALEAGAILKKIEERLSSAKNEGASTIKIISNSKQN